MTSWTNSRTTKPNAHACHQMVCMQFQCEWTETHHLCIAVCYFSFWFCTKFWLYRDIVIKLFRNLPLVVGSSDIVCDIPCSGETKAQQIKIYRVTCIHCVVNACDFEYWLTFVYICVNTFICYDGMVLFMIWLLFDYCCCCCCCYCSRFTIHLDCAKQAHNKAEQSSSNGIKIDSSKAINSNTRRGRRRARTHTHTGIQTLYCTMYMKLATSTREAEHRTSTSTKTHPRTHICICVCEYSLSFFNNSERNSVTSKKKLDKFICKCTNHKWWQSKGRGWKKKSSSYPHPPSSLIQFR